MNQNELREQENRCIQEHAPACTAACPVHVDVRGLTKAIAEGDYQSAYVLYRKAVPFPGIISKICEQPCKQTCLRKNLGGSIEIAALERACLAFGSLDAAPIKALPRKAKTVAIIGAGISGLTAAYDLARKGWGVIIYEAADRLGGGLWQIPADQLPRELLSDDLQIIEQLGIEVHLNASVCRTGGNGNSTPLSRLSEMYDAIYLGCGSYSHDVDDLKLDQQRQIKFDDFTFQTSLPKVFAGGEVLRLMPNYPEYGEHHSAILSISDGRRAATSIDRYLQNVSLSASRTNEGAYTTRLFTNTNGVAVEKPLMPTDSSTRYDAEVAKTEAARCIQCECMECVKRCTYLAHYKGYPKKYIREIYNNLSIVMGTRYSNQFINSCALCGLCAEVCPADVDMGLICHDARIQMVAQNRMPASAHDFALRDMAFSNGEKFALARHAPGMDTNQYLFFPGCQLSGSSPAYVEKMFAFLMSTINSEGVGLMLRCCGAPADWAGRKDLFQQSREEFLDAYKQLGNPKLIVACSSCYQLFTREYPEIEVLSFWEVFNQHGIQTLPQAHYSTPIAIHDPCSTRYDGHIQDAIRSILTKMGCTIEELPLHREKTICCSYGGLMWLANKAVAQEMVQQRISESPLDYVTYCAMCRDFFARQGKRTVHILDLIYGSAGVDYAVSNPVGFSQRHENRAHLKEKLLQEYWSESMPTRQAYEAIQLILPESVQQLVEERLILIEDLQKVIEAAESSGRRMFNPSSGHYLAYFKPNSVTYWVEYTPQDESFLIHKAYSHRMEIGMGAQKMSQYVDLSDYQDWVCADCKIPLQPDKVDISYLGNSFPVELLQCPKCGLVLIPEELALGKMAEVEKSLEDK